MQRQHATIPLFFILACLCLVLAFNQWYFWRGVYHLFLMFGVYPGDVAALLFLYLICLGFMLAEVYNYSA